MTEPDAQSLLDFFDEFLKSSRIDDVFNGDLAPSMKQTVDITNPATLRKRKTTTELNNETRKPKERRSTSPDIDVLKRALERLASSNIESSDAISISSDSTGNLS